MSACRGFTSFDFLSDPVQVCAQANSIAKWTRYFDWITDQSPSPLGEPVPQSEAIREGRERKVSPFDQNQANHVLDSDGMRIPIKNVKGKKYRSSLLSKKIPGHLIDHFRKEKLHFGYLRGWEVQKKIPFNTQPAVSKVFWTKH